MEHPEELKKDWFNEYKTLGGEHSEKHFLKNLDMFFDLTLDAYIEGGEKTGKTRDEAYDDWIKYIDNYMEAALYFKAVDRVTSYS